MAISSRCASIAETIVADISFSDLEFLGLRLSSRLHVLIHTTRNGFLAPPFSRHPNPADHRDLDRPAVDQIEDAAAQKSLRDPSASIIEIGSDAAEALRRSARKAASLLSLRRWL
jgi:hypothetical protein